MIPARLFGTGELRADIAAVPAWSTLLTSMFMHGSWLHLGLNMLFLGFSATTSKIPWVTSLCRLLPRLRHCRGDDPGLIHPNSTIPMVAKRRISGFSAPICCCTLMPPCAY